MIPISNDSLIFSVLPLDSTFQKYRHFHIVFCHKSVGNLLSMKSLPFLSNLCNVHNLARTPWCRSHTNNPSFVRQRSSKLQSTRYFENPPEFHDSIFWITFHLDVTFGPLPLLLQYRNWIEIYYKLTKITTGQHKKQNQRISGAKFLLDAIRFDAIEFDASRVKSRPILDQNWIKIGSKLDQNWAKIGPKLNKN